MNVCKESHKQYGSFNVAIAAFPFNLPCWFVCIEIFVFSIQSLTFFHFHLIKTKLCTMKQYCTQKLHLSQSISPGTQLGYNDVVWYSVNATLSFKGLAFMEF